MADWLRFHFVIARRRYTGSSAPADSADCRFGDMARGREGGKEREGEGRGGEGRGLSTPKLSSPNIDNTAKFIYNPQSYEVLFNTETKNAFEKLNIVSHRQLHQRLLKPIPKSLNTFNEFVHSKLGSPVSRHTDHN